MTQKSRAILLWLTMPFLDRLVPEEHRSDTNVISVSIWFRLP